jgi:hypothetical protein
MENNIININGSNNIVLQNIENSNIYFDSSFNLISRNGKKINILDAEINFELEDKTIVYYPYFELEQIRPNS